MYGFRRVVGCRCFVCCFVLYVVRPVCLSLCVCVFVLCRSFCMSLGISFLRYVCLSVVRSFVISLFIYLFL